MKLTPDVKPFRCAYGNVNFDKGNAMKSFVEGLVEADLITQAQSDGVAPSTLVPKKCQTYGLVANYRGLKKQIDKTCWPFPGTKDVIDSLEKNCFS